MTHKVVVGDGASVVVVVGTGAASPPLHAAVTATSTEMRRVQSAPRRATRADLSRPSRPRVILHPIGCRAIAPQRWPPRTNSLRNRTASPSWTQTSQWLLRAGNGAVSSVSSRGPSRALSAKGAIQALDLSATCRRAPRVGLFTDVTVLTLRREGIGGSPTYLSMRERSHAAPFQRTSTPVQPARWPTRRDHRCPVCDTHE